MGFKSDHVGALVPAPRKPRHLLPPDGRAIRDAHDELDRIGGKDMGALVNLSLETIRGIETGNTSYDKEGFIASCEEAARTGEEPAAGVMRDLAAALRSLLEESAKIDVQHGTDKRASGQTRPSFADANEIAGEWAVIWETVRDGLEVWVDDAVELRPVRARGRFELASRSDGNWNVRHVSGEPLELEDHEVSHHFWWMGAGCYFQQWISGYFASLPHGPKVSGSFHLMYDTFNDAMVGRWLGVSRASEQTHATLVMARTREMAEKLFTERDSDVIESLAPTATA